MEVCSTVSICKRPHLVAKAEGFSMSKVKNRNQKSLFFWVRNTLYDIAEFRIAFYTCNMFVQIRLKKLIEKAKKPAMYVFLLLTA